MREILFRGKRIDNGEWVEGCYGSHSGIEAFIVDRPYISINGTFEALNFYDVDPETVGQYTGLKDKNGKRIFEGDIFRFPDEVWESCYTSCGTEYNSWEVENYGVVGFCEESAKYDFVKYKYNENSVEADLHENGNLEFAGFLAELEVIGNIHDNKSLLNNQEAGE